jgi:hypothetical protein
MDSNFRISKIAKSVGVVLGSSLFMPGISTAGSCVNIEANGTCGLQESQVTTNLSPKPTAWYFITPSQDAVITEAAKKQSVYFASGTSHRTTSDLQSLLIDGANLSGHYVNASAEGSVNIVLANNASVDWLEAGGAKTNIAIRVDNSTLNGAKVDADYDGKGTTPASKNYARGSAIYLSAADSGNQKIDVVNGSKLNGQILTGGAGSHEVNIDNSQIKQGGIIIYGAPNDNTVAIKNGSVDTTDIAIATYGIFSTDNALSITNATDSGKTNAVSLDNSQLTGTLFIDSIGGINQVQLVNSTVKATTDASGNAIAVKSGKNTSLTAVGSDVIGNLELSGREQVSTALLTTRLTGDLSVNAAAQAALDITQTTINGSVTAAADAVTMNITDSSVAGDVVLDNSAVKSAAVTLDNALVGGHLHGGVNSTLTLAQTMTRFSGDKFSGFNALNVNGATSLRGGFTDNNVGETLQVNGGRLTAPVSLTHGALAFNGTRLMADTVALSGSSSIALNNSSLLETSSAQLFTHSAQAANPQGFNATGSRLTLNNSTLALTDDTYQLEYVTSVNALLGDHTGSALVMMGKLRDAEQAVGTATVTDAATTGAVLAQVELTADKNKLLIGSSVAPTGDHLAVQNGFGAARLTLGGAGQHEVQIVGGQSLTLTGALGGALVNVEGAPDAVVNIKVDEGALNLGTRATGDTSGTLHGVVNVAEAGAMNVVAGEHTITSGSDSAGVVSSGQVNIHQDAILNADVALQDRGQLTIGGTLNAGTLTAGHDAQITVGDANSAGSLVVEHADLQGARVFIDPVWNSGSAISDASEVLLGGQQVNGRLTVGQNSLLVLGDTSRDAAHKAFAETGLSWAENGITAAVAIGAPQYLNAGNGGLRVDGALTSASVNKDAVANQAEFGERSLLMVKGADAEGTQAALNADGGTLKVADSAALYVADAKADTTYNIAQGFTDVQMKAHGWQGNNLIINKLLNANTRENNGVVSVTTTAKAAQDVLPGVVTKNALNRMISGASNSLTSPDAGIRFLSRAIESPDVQVNEVVKAVNSAAQMAIAAGVQSSTLATGMAAKDAILARTSVVNRDAKNDGDRANVWVHALYGDQRSRDLQAGSMSYGYDSSFFGIMLGGDVAWESSVGSMMSGAAFHAGNGKSNSSGDFNETRNHFNFWGVSLYQNWATNGFNVTGDVGFSAASNDLNQKLPGWMNFGNELKGSVDSQLFTAGVTGEYLIATTAVDIIPYAGARYNQLVAKGFETKNGDSQAVFKTDKDKQNIWQFPAGVKLNKTFALDSGWALSTQADMAVIASAGDIQTSSLVRATGINASDKVYADVTDKTSFNGQAGLRLQKGNMSWGVGYNLNASEHSTGQTISASYRLTF